MQTHINGWFRTTSGVADEVPKNGGANTVASPDTVKAVPLPDAVKSPLPAKTVRKVTKSTQQIVGSLMGAPSPGDRSALFDDTPAEPSKVPGNLHFSTDQNIKDAIDQAGAVALVRQLAGDLAQRDAQITALRRRAEERERILKKMLQECEVSNMDIESRLRDLEKSREQSNELTKQRTRGDSALSGLHPDDSMEDRLARAMEDEVAQHPDALGIDTAGSAPRADVASIHSTASDVPLEIGRPGWKNYIWNGTSRKSSRAPSVASMVDREASSLAG